MVEAVKQNFPQREIADAALRATSRRSTPGERIVVGVNALHRGRRRADADPAASTRRSSASRSTACRRVRARRDGAGGRGGARRAARAPPRPTRNLMPPLLDCARAHATEGEIVAGAAGGLRHLHRDAGLLSAMTAARVHGLRPADVGRSCSPHRGSAAERAGDGRDGVGHAHRPAEGLVLLAVARHASPRGERGALRLGRRARPQPRRPRRPRPPRGPRAAATAVHARVPPQWPRPLHLLHPSRNGDDRPRALVARPKLRVRNWDRARRSRTRAAPSGAARAGFRRRPR